MANQNPKDADGHDRLFGLIPDGESEKERLGYIYLIRVELPDGSRKEFGYRDGTINRWRLWVLDHRRCDLAKWYGVDPEDVTVHHRPRRSPSGVRRPEAHRIKPGHVWDRVIF